MKRRRSARWAQRSFALAALAILPSCIGTIEADGEAGPIVPTPTGGTTGTPALDGEAPAKADEDDVFAVVATTRFARLSHFEWGNTVRDLFGLDEPPAEAARLQRDPVLGFDNTNGESGLLVTPELSADYQAAAEVLAARAISDAKIWTALTADLPASDPARRDTFIERFGARAYRRPLDDSDSASLTSAFSLGASLVGSGDQFRDGVRLVIETVLQSPHFLYRIELGGGERGDTSLTQYEIASRLSYSVAGTLPDAELLEAAAAHVLGDAESRRAHAGRLAATAVGRTQYMHMHDQLYRLPAYQTIGEGIDEGAAAEASLGTDATTEVRLFLADLHEDGDGIAEILTRPTTFANARLARLYGVSGPSTSDFTRVDLPAGKRAGLLTHIGFLARHAHGAEPDAIHRGVFVNRAIVCTDLPAPVDDVPMVPARAGSTNRERIEALTGEGTCGGVCHGTLINPLGFAYEHYDGLGRYRQMDAGKPVDAAGTFAFSDGSFAFRDAVDLAKLLADRPDVHACYSRNWLAYALGRELVDGDAGFVTRLARLSRAGHSVPQLLGEVVASPAFVAPSPLPEGSP